MIEAKKLNNGWEIWTEREAKILVDSSMTASKYTQGKLTNMIITKSKKVNSSSNLSQELDIG